MNLLGNVIFFIFGGFLIALAMQRCAGEAGVLANAVAPDARTRMTEDLLGALGDKLQPELVSPLVTYLAHESCEATGRVFSVGGGRVAEVFIGECAGQRFLLFVGAGLDGAIVVAQLIIAWLGFAQLEAFAKIAPQLSA